MSIWCTRTEIGWSDEGWATLDGVAVEPAVSGGEVRSYADGFSNHFPTVDDTVERRAMVDTASIPVWCVPGHEDGDDDTTVGPWLRLGFSSVRHDSSTEQHYVVGAVAGAVVLDEAAVEALRDELTAWLDTPKAHPAAALPALSAGQPANAGADCSTAENVECRTCGGKDVRTLDAQGWHDYCADCTPPETVGCST